MVGFLALVTSSGAILAGNQRSVNDCWHPGDPARSIANCTRVLEDKSEPATGARAYTYAGRGRAYLEKGDFEHAIEDFNEAIRLDPRLFFAYYWRGLSFFRMRDFDRAIAAFSDLIRVDIKPESPFALMALVARGLRIA